MRKIVYDISRGGGGVSASSCPCPWAPMNIAVNFKEHRDMCTLNNMLTGDHTMPGRCDIL